MLKQAPMNKALKFIAHEFNPLHDMDGAKPESIHNKSSFSEMAAAQGRNIVKLVTHVPKHMARGIITGGLAGAFLSAVTGTPVEEGLRMGAASVMAIDTMQFMGRYSYLYIEAHLLDKG